MQLHIPVHPREHDDVFRQLSETLCPFRAVCQDSLCQVLFSNYSLLSSAQICLFFPPQLRYLVQFIRVITLHHTVILKNQV